jgi:nitrogen fixation NifU-like protein
MRNELNELYQQVILDHNKNPQNFRAIDHPSHLAHGHNPLCGDKIDIYVKVENGIITDVSFQGSGCAISKASASIMTTVLIGKTLDEAKAMFDDFHHVVTADTDEDLDLDSMGKLAVFSGVREFPARIKCASLAWHTLQNALNNSEEATVSTEEQIAESEF